MFHELQQWEEGPFSSPLTMTALKWKVPEKEVPGESET